MGPYEGAFRAATIFSVTGSGAGTCLQGILSGDVVGPGPNTVGYAAALSPKGMILFGGWSGYLQSDTWRFDNNRWSVYAE